MIVQTFTAATVPTAGGGARCYFPDVNAIVSEERSAGRAEPGAPPAPAVSVKHVSKSFKLPHERYHTLKERALHPFRKKQMGVLHAVRDVSVEIAPGEFFGIVGRNGSGKSTLLKCLAGIYRIDEGELAVNGRLSPFIELGVGFNMELTARDNVIINAIMLGLTRKQARERFDEILAFAELEEFVDLKLKNYSSGMYVRLAFATAVQVDADILLIDEVLAVGDSSFQQKCFDEFTRLREAGRTILFVTHDMNAVERFCDRAMLLDRGRPVEIGEPSAVARHYNELNFRRPAADAVEGDSPEASGRVAEIVRASFESPDGEVLVTTEQGTTCHVRMDVRFLDDVRDPIFAISLQNEAGQTVFKTSTETQRIATGRFTAGSTASVRLAFENWLGPGRYRLYASVARSGIGIDVYAVDPNSSIIVLAQHAGGGLTDMPHSFEIERG
jgi:ABC-type polysaccharide/polyol phosphate transport system ATPase subunit